jgi:hypothetical protein
MAEARSRERWAHTSALLALTANVHRDHRKKADALQASGLQPLPSPSEELPVRKASIEVLKQVFVDRR